MLRPGRFRWCQGRLGADDLIFSGTAASGVTARDKEGRRGSAVTSGLRKAGEAGSAWGWHRPVSGPGSCSRPSEPLPMERVQTRGVPGHREGAAGLLGALGRKC